MSGNIWSSMSDLDKSIDLKSTIDTFDQNGFDLTDLEIMYAKKMLS